MNADYDEPMSARGPLALVLAAGTLLAAGCGAEEGSDPESASFSNGEQQAVATTIQDISEATGSRDYAKICSDYLAAPLVKQLAEAEGSEDCADRIERSLRDVDQSDLAVREVTVEGSSAEAVVQPSGTGEVEEQARLSLVKEGSRWKLSGIG